NPASDMTLEKNTYWKILRNQLTVLGTWNSSFRKAEDDDWHYCLDMMSSGRVNPEMLVTHRFTLDKLEDGLKIMRDKTEDYVKIMTTFEK
ncbi:MAG: galactitol-1-phosphate 5-dehydrogenase, partial [Lachnospiraceae bacterium]|nr:galactitol-1-phosphate 5-dehydrogenase [Lachnospiraceae bacterium]